MPLPFVFERDQVTPITVFFDVQELDVVEPYLFTV
tara:strand:- start:4184 stop:4288 length:105 start_codon:yes stop_codon:yes gene_type:complete